LPGSPHIYNGEAHSHLGNVPHLIQSGSEGSDYHMVTKKFLLSIDSLSHTTTYQPSQHTDASKTRQMPISNHSAADKALIDSLPGRDLIEFRNSVHTGNWLPPATPVPYDGNYTSFDENMAVGPYQSESAPFTMPDEQFWGSTMQDLLTSNLFMSNSFSPDFTNEFTSASQPPNDSASSSSSLPPPPPNASTGISAPKSRKRGRSEGADTANIVESARTRTKSAWAQWNLMKLCPGHRSGPRRRSRNIIKNAPT
ncbi:hypothetical protein C8J57DRAFT_1651522, partial [Mycena rebaudengoi]